MSEMCVLFRYVLKILEIIPIWLRGLGSAECWTRHHNLLSPGQSTVGNCVKYKFLGSVRHPTVFHHRNSKMLCFDDECFNT